MTVILSRSLQFFLDRGKGFDQGLDQLFERRSGDRTRVGGVCVRFVLDQGLGLDQELGLGLQFFLERCMGLDQANRAPCCVRGQDERSLMRGQEE